MPTAKKDVFSMGPLKRDFLRRAKTREVGGGEERGGWMDVAFMLFVVGLCRGGEVGWVGGWREGAVKLVCGEERTTRMLEGKCVIIVGVAGRTLTEVWGERVVRVVVLMEPEGWA